MKSWGQIYSKARWSCCKNSK